MPVKPASADLKLPIHVLSVATSLRRITASQRREASWPREKVVAELAENGDDRDRVVADLEQLRAALRDEGRDDDEDIVLDVIGMVVGWSGPRVRT